MSSLKRKERQRQDRSSEHSSITSTQCVCASSANSSVFLLRKCALSAVTGRSPGDEQRRVVVRGVAVVLDVLSLLPHTEVVESRGSVEAHRGSFLPQEKQKEISEDESKELQPEMSGETFSKSAVQPQSTEHRAQSQGMCW